MSLTEKIASDLINAMKAKDNVSLEAIRAAKTAFILARSEKGSGYCSESRRGIENHSETCKTEKGIRCNIQGTKQT